MKTRIYFLDNLRTFIIMLVVILHAGIVYAPILDNVMIVSGPEKSKGLVLLTLYLDIFLMFVMFFISGYFVSSSLKKSGTGGFIVSKFRRIMVPWVISIFTLIPLYKVIFLYSRGLPQQAWYSYFIFYSDPLGNPAFFADNPVQSWLWFLPLLFIFQLAYLLLARTGALKIRMSFAWALAITFLASVAYNMLVSSYGLSGWFHSVLLQFQRERILPYFLVFLLGSLCNSQGVFERMKVRTGHWAGAIAGSILMLAVFTAFSISLLKNILEPGRGVYIVTASADLLIYFASVMASMFLILYLLIVLFRKTLDYGSPLLSWLSRNSYPVYILHMVVMGFLALIMMPVHLPALIKFPLLALFTYIASNLLAGLQRVVTAPVSMRKYAWVAIPVLAIFFSVALMAITHDHKYSTGGQHLVKDNNAAPETGIHMAVIRGDLRAVRHHISHGTDLNMPEPSDGSSPLITAAVFGQTEIALELISAGADINFQNRKGSTPLHSAAFFCREEIIDALLGEHANAEIKDMNGLRAVQLVELPWESVKPAYDQFSNTLAPLGLRLNYERLKSQRPGIAKKLNAIHTK